MSLHYDLVGRLLFNLHWIESISDKRLRDRLALWKRYTDKKVENGYCTENCYFDMM